MKKIVIFTSQHLRHSYLRIYLSNKKGIKVLRSYTEKKSKFKNLKKNQYSHLRLRDKYESHFFKKFIDNKKDLSNPKKCSRGFISSKTCLNEIDILNPDLIIVFGSSILKGKIIKKYYKKILNLHLGLSPYYRGSGTNFFPFVNNQLNYVGSTFMFLDKGIDTGEIIHQEKAMINNKTDNIHTIGFKLIKRSIKVFSSLILNFEKIERKKIRFSKYPRKYYKRSHFDLKSLIRLKINLKRGMIKNYNPQPTKIITQKFIK